VKFRRANSTTGNADRCFAGAEGSGEGTPPAVRPRRCLIAVNDALAPFASQSMKFGSAAADLRAGNSAVSNHQSKRPHGPFTHCRPLMTDF
jgi:hypothetical protein